MTLNHSAIRRHALKISKAARAGKFTRVSEEFINKIERVVDFMIDERHKASFNSIMADVEIDPADDFMTGEGKRALCEAFRVWIGRRIHSEVNGTRVGKTL